MSDAYDDLTDIVADLKKRVEALERELASRPVESNYRVEPSSLAGKWDNMENAEHRWSEDDFA